MFVVLVLDVSNKWLVNIDVKLTNRYASIELKNVSRHFKDYKYDYTSYSSDDYYGDLGDILSFL